jgi:hypothetical protein
MLDTAIFAYSRLIGRLGEDLSQQGRVEPNPEPGNRGTGVASIPRFALLVHVGTCLYHSKSVAVSDEPG